MQSRWLVALVLVAGCRGGDDGPATADAEPGIDGDLVDHDATPADATPPDAEEPAPDAMLTCDTSPAACAQMWEDDAAARMDAVLTDEAALKDFLFAMPKGGDLHQHLNGAVYAETYLDWGSAAGNCINPTSYSAGSSSTCSTGNVPIPGPGTFYDNIVRAWSMEDFVPGTESGHDHFFATFGKYGLIAGGNRNESIADVANRAASENQVYIETMFNLGSNVGGLAASVWSGSVSASSLDTFYDQLLANSQFATKLTSDVAVVTNALSGFRNELGCSGATPQPGCGVTVRFIAQISRTGANDQIFGQLVSAFEMAKQTGQLVGANLSSPEDDSSAINNYNLHMAMIAFLREKYTATDDSPLHITLHAGELVPAYLPSGSTANTFHIREAVVTAEAERIGHGIDLESETDYEDLLVEMASRGVLVEVCLSSNAQILEVDGAEHPLADYLAAGVPVALATDDQGVSRSSLAGEALRAVQDQGLDYHQLKRLARNSLEHAFLPGDSLWSSISAAQPAPACTPTLSMAIGDPPNASCQAFLALSERARMQWELERRFLAFERD